MEFNYKGNKQQAYFILIAIILVLLGSVLVNAQNEANAEVKQSWFSSFIGFFKSFFTKMFNTQTQEPETLVNTSEENQSNIGNINENENITMEITSNITCGYCQYELNNTCLNYSCCNDSECNANETCPNNECIPLNCTSCQYVENHKCVDYECYNNTDCGINQTCSEHNCVGIETRCPSSCPQPEISPTTGNICAYYYCNASTHYTQDFYCRREIIRPCCGDNRCDVALGENESNCPIECTNVSKFIYCEQNSDCTPCCWTVGTMDPLEIKGRGTCMNKNYSCDDYPGLYPEGTCGKEFVGWCNTCGCVNNQCVTIQTTDYRC